MGAATLVSVDDYLHTSFPDGDREYIDGRLVERNVGEVDHSDLQGKIYRYLCDHYSQYWSGVEVRVQVGAKRFRVPDVTLIVQGKPLQQIVVSPPHLVIEVLSKDDRADELQEKIDDYLTHGIPFVWVANPRTRRGWVYTPAGASEARDGVLRTSHPAIEVPLAALFD